MKSPFSPVLLAFSLILAACQDAREAKASRWEAGVRYKDAPAEVIRDSLAPLGPHLKLAIIRDGEAEVYFEGTRQEVDELLAGARDQQPQAMIIEHLRRRDEALPPPPSQSPTLRISVDLNREAMARRKISMAEAADQVSTILATANPEDIASVFGGKSLLNSAGDRVPFDEFAVARPVKVLRPLILPPTPREEENAKAATTDEPADAAAH